MLQRDYIIRLLREFAQALGSIIQRRQAGQLNEAVDEISKASRTHLGIESGNLTTLSADELKTALHLTGNPNDARVLIAADLLVELSHVRSASAMDDVIELRRKALDLYITALTSAELGADDSTVYVGRVEALYRELADQGLDLQLVDRWFKVCVEKRYYATAEDVLFDLLDAGPENRISPLGEEFYRHLKSRRDAELEAGGLPRDEVDSGEKSFAEALAEKRAGRD